MELAVALGVPGPLVGCRCPRAVCEGAPGANSPLGAAFQLEMPSPTFQLHQFLPEHPRGPSANTSVLFNEEQGRERSCLQISKVQLTKGRRETQGHNRKSSFLFAHRRKLSCCDLTASRSLNVVTGSEEALRLQQASLQPLLLMESSQFA